MNEETLPTKPRLEGRVAIVTGAGGGIGRATSLALSREGARLVLVDRDERAVSALTQELSSESLAIAADVTQPADVEDYVRAASERFGRIDILFNNAGIEGQVASTANASAASWDAVMNVNVTGVWLNLKYTIQAMLAQGSRGSIINTSSGLGRRGSPQMGAYSASKHAVIGMTRAAALEYAHRGIRVNAICPGTIDTPMMTMLEELSGDKDRRARIEESIPIGRYGAPEEIAQAVLFLASDNSLGITGATLAVDGGKSA